VHSFLVLNETALFLPPLCAKYPTGEDTWRWRPGGRHGAAPAAGVLGGDFGVRLTALQLRRRWQWCRQHLCKPSLLHGAPNFPENALLSFSKQHQSMCFPLANGRIEGEMGPMRFT